MINTAGEPRRQGFWDKMEPIDLVALMIIIGGLILVGFHIDGIVGGLLISVTAYYFGKRGRVSKEDIK